MTRQMAIGQTWFSRTVLLLLLIGLAGLVVYERYYRDARGSVRYEYYTFDSN